MHHKWVYLKLQITTPTETLINGKRSLSKYIVYCIVTLYGWVEGIHKYIQQSIYRHYHFVLPALPMFCSLSFPQYTCMYWQIILTSWFYLTWFFFSVEFKVSIILIRFEVSGSNDYSNRFLLQWTWNSCMKVIEGYFILYIFPSFLSTNRMCPWHQHEFVLYTDGPRAEFVKSSRFTSCFILSSLHANSLVMKKTRRHRIFLKTENPCRPFSHDAYNCCRPLNGFIDGLKDEYSIYMSHY